MSALALSPEDAELERRLWEVHNNQGSWDRDVDEEQSPIRRMIRVIQQHRAEVTRG